MQAADNVRHRAGHGGAVAELFGNPSENFVSITSVCKAFLSRISDGFECGSIALWGSEQPGAL